MMKSNFKRVHLSCMFIFISICSFAQKNNDIMKKNTESTGNNESNKNKIDSTFDLYLLIGQSNMAGRGPITKKYLKEGNPHVLMLTKENTWVAAKNPLHFDKPKIAGVGPGLSFGIAMQNFKTSRKIGLIPCAVGGTLIDSWNPGGYDSATKTHPYNDMLLHLEAALQSGVLKGVLWLQGESDSKPEKAAVYLSKLEELIQQIRTIANNNELPFVAGELGRYRAEFQNINKVLKSLPGSIQYTAVASSRGLKDKGDHTHFNSESQEKMGKRMAKKMRELQKEIGSR